MSDTSSPASTTPTASGPGFISAVSKSKAPLPSRNACLSCRAQKTRCTPVEGSDKCARCFRHDLDCVHKRHQRGPKRSVFVKPCTKFRTNLTRGSSKNPPSEEEEPTAKRQAWGTGPRPSSPDGQLKHKPHNPYASPITTAEPMPPSERIEPPSFSLETILCESCPDDLMDPSDQYSDYFDDPVTLNMLSEHKANALFDL